jgi:hypothetical protein
VATQRMTIAKVAGLAADLVLARLGAWAADREVTDTNEWSSDQWPSAARTEADALADGLRANSLSPPVIHFVEWADQWSMGDVFRRCLTSPAGPLPLAIHANRFQIYGYGLPDGGHLERHLQTSGLQQFDEYDRFVYYLLEAVGAWRELAERSVLIVLREVVGGLVTDEELNASMCTVPDWLVEGCPPRVRRSLR